MGKMGRACQGEGAILDPRQLSGCRSHRAWKRNSKSAVVTGPWWPTSAETGRRLPSAANIAEFRFKARSAAEMASSGRSEGQGGQGGQGHTPELAPLPAE